MIDNEFPKKKQLKRYFRCQIELGPYLGTERKRYAFWHAKLGQGRIMTAVEVGRGKKRKVLYRAILDTTGFHCDMDVDKFVLIFGGHHLYHVIEPQLRQISGPLVKMSGDTHQNDSAYWHTFEIRHGAETLQRWRDEVHLDHKYCVRDHSEGLTSLRELYRDILTEERGENFDYFCFRSGGSDQNCDQRVIRSGVTYW